MKKLSRSMGSGGITVTLPMKKNPTTGDKLVNLAANLVMNLALPITSLVLGLLNFNVQCEGKGNEIALWLVVDGSFSFCSKLCDTFTKFCGDMGYLSTDSEGKVEFSSSVRSLTVLTTIFNISWFIYGCTLIFSVDQELTDCPGNMIRYLYIKDVLSLTVISLVLCAFTLALFLGGVTIR
jgi:hypothetical protein